MALKMLRLDILIPSWLKDALQELAAEKGLTPSEYIRDVLKEHVNSQKRG
jgi:predicted DNA-binding protein